MEKKKSGRKPKSSFYHTRNAVGLNEERAAEVIGVTTEEIRRFDTDGAPMMAERLLLLWDNKHVGHVGWDGFIFSRGVLRYRNRRWTPKTILLFREQDDELNRLKNDLERFRTWNGLFTIFVDKVVNELTAKQRFHKRGLF
jgi:hypothetical protein